MKKLLLSLWLLLVPTIAAAQCNGIFQPNTICGNTKASPSVPSQVPQSAITGIPGGTNGQIQYNNNGNFGGTGPLTCPVGQFLNAAGAPFACGIPPGAITGTISVTGATATYTSAQNALIIKRSNSGAAMADTLPGASPGILPANTVIVVQNTDTTAIMSIGAGSGAILNGSLASTGFAYLCPGQTAEFYSDGSNYWQLSGPTKCKLTANTTIFASVAGSGNGNGLTSANSIAGIQAMWNFAIALLDLNGFNLTLQCADGTYSSASSINLMGSFIGQTNVYDSTGVFSTSANVILQGDVATPDNAIISYSGSTTQALMVASGAALIINGFKIVGGSGFYDVLVNGAFAQITNVDFGACVEGQVSASASAFVYLSPPYKISGSCAAHVIAGAQGAFIAFLTISGVVTITGTPAFSTAFAVAQSGNIGALTAVTFSGSATGVRYEAFLNGIISVGSSTCGSGTFFPGSSAGTCSTGGQYQ